MRNRGSVDLESLKRLKRRRDQRATRRGQAKVLVRPRWQILLESPTVAALLTVLFGGLVAGAVGQYLSYQYQASLRARDAALAKYETYLKRGDETITTSLTLIGRVISASEDAIALSKLDDGDHRYSAGGEKYMIARRAEVGEAFRTATRAWSADRQKNTLLLRYYHNSDPEVIAAWNTLNQNVTNYTECARRVYVFRATRGFLSSRPERCIGERQAFEVSIDRFCTARLAAAHKEAVQE